MIFCIGLAADDTFCHTLNAIKRTGYAFDAIDFAQLALAGEFSAPLDEPEATVISVRGKRFELGSYDSVYLRLVNIAEAAPSADLRRRAEGLYQGLIRLFSHCEGIPVLNPPRGECSNFSKFYHAVALAQPRNWTIPRTCLTNQPSEARSFIDSCDQKVIFKGASSMKTWAVSWNPAEHQARLAMLNVSPVLFQERIDGPDVRIHVVGQKIFAERIESCELDYRTTRGNRYGAITPPDSILAGCIGLARECKTPFLGVDFKIEKETGVWYFLEANTMPCYEGYDRRAGGRISGALVDWLVRRQIREMAS
jgi:hypothetical protein